MKYYTFGLPHQSQPNTIYEFKMMDRHIYIPGNYVGRDEVGEPNYPEQVAWLNSLGKQLEISEVWYGCWKLNSAIDEEKFINILKESKVLHIFSIDYEVAGHFDKDEQGWCSDRISLICTDGKYVKIRKYYDANGIIRSDYTVEAIIDKKEGQKLYLQYLQNNSKAILDLETQKLL
jgi:hypothetical protein